MSWVVVVWAMIASACLTLAFTHAVIGARQPLLRSHLLFAGTAAAVAVIAAFELMLMRSQSIEEYARLLRWAHVPLFFMFVCAVFFVREYFCAGRLWLAYLVCALRFVALVMNFSSGANLNFQEVTALRQITFLGEPIAVAEGTINPWGWIAPLCSLLYIVYVIDASLSAWRTGSRVGRRRALAVGGSIVFFIVAATVHAHLVLREFIDSPFLISAAFFATLLVMAYGLGADVVRSAHLAQELGRNERRMQLAVEAAGVGLWEWDTRGDRIHIIHGDPTLFGPEARAIGNLDSFLARIHAEDRDAVRAAIRDALASGNDCRLEFRVAANDSHAPRWIGSRGRVEYGADGKPFLMRGVVYDVTQRRTAQERVRVVLDATPNGFAMVDPEGAIVMVNAQTEKMFGYDRGELLGLRIEHLVPEGLREAHAVQRGHYQSSPTARPMFFGRDVLGRRKDGSSVALEIGLTPVDMPDGRFVLAAIVDVSERQHLKREMAQRSDELAHLSRVAVLGELSGSLAHELKQPLAAILSNAQAAQHFIRRDPQAIAEVPQALADIVQESKRAVELIDRLRDLFRKGEAGREPLNMNEVVAGALSILHGELPQRGLTPTVELAPELPAVRGDRVQLQQVLLNLIINAVHAMQNGPPERHRLVVRTARADGDHIEVCVSDTGGGIPPDDLQRIFEPFVTSKKDGLGLGLTVCRAIVEAHGGSLSAENNPERGASFRLTLPVASTKVLVPSAQPPLASVRIDLGSTPKQAGPQDAPDSPRIQEAGLSGERPIL